MFIFKNEKPKSSMFVKLPHFLLQMHFIIYPKDFFKFWAVSPDFFFKFSKCTHMHYPSMLNVFICLKKNMWWWLPLKIYLKKAAPKSNDKIKIIVHTFYLTCFSEHFELKHSNFVISRNVLIYLYPSLLKANYVTVYYRRCFCRFYNYKFGNNFKMFVYR